MMRRSKAGQGFWQDGAGAAAVEFALVIPMLLVLVFSTLEAGWMMMQTIMLDRALDQTVRELRVGSFANPTQEKMRQKVCERAMILADCQAHLALELFPITGSTGYPTDEQRCVNRNSTVAPVLRFTQGARTQTMYVRACFVVSPMTPGMGLGLAMPKDSTGAIRIIAKSGFINEP
ncbi:TadE/TadG family type IV pilus assembly protein [Devosia aurantiaca]|uniref:Pilus assembly protein n=1 Tax=Devosia aurantiaca TaxID=2714858 RepID=A0A6M1SHV1_9HYPH|nr:TadE/TadG family type IV pilus assembly protein [Devosia aurantiaca]NGP19389.1 pilus assembly protein [Devosia aurantiaca]